MATQRPRYRLGDGSLDDMEELLLEAQEQLGRLRLAAVGQRTRARLDVEEDCARLLSATAADLASLTKRWLDATCAEMPDEDGPAETQADRLWAAGVAVAKGDL